MQSIETATGVFYRKVVLKNFAKFTRKHLWRSLFFNKVAGLACNLIKKETPEQALSCEFCGIFKYTYSEEQLRRAASAGSN